MVRISLFGLSVLPLRRTLAETTLAVRPLLLFVAVIVAISFVVLFVYGGKGTKKFGILFHFPLIIYLFYNPCILKTRFAHISVSFVAER